jgi:hypothetical protein
MGEGDRPPKSGWWRGRAAGTTAKRSLEQAAKEIPLHQLVDADVYAY